MLSRTQAFFFLLCCFLIFSAMTCLIKSIEFNDYHKVYYFSFSETELRERLLSGYKEDTLNHEAYLFNPFFPAIEKPFTQQLREKDTVSFSIRKDIRLQCLIYGDSIQSHLEILSITQYRNRKYERDKSIYEKRILKTINQNLIQKLVQK